MAASQAHERNGPKKSPWTPEEDQKLIACINTLNRRGVRIRWGEVPKLARLNRSWKSCNMRWNQYLRPDIKRGNLSQDEKETIIRLQADLGNKWVLIARQLPGRTAGEIKNFWNTHSKKKIGKKDISPQPFLAAAVFSDSCANYLRGYAQRLCSDARLPSPHHHGVGFISTDPVGALPGQRSGINYQDIEDPPVHNYPYQFGPFITGILNTIPFPQVNQNYAAHVNSLFGSLPPATQTQIQPLLAVADWLASIAAYLRGYAEDLHSDVQLPNLHSLHNPVVQHGSGDITPDLEAIVGFNPDPKVNNNYAAEFGSMFGNVPNAGSTPALMVSTAASLRGYAQGLHSDAQLSNLQLLHNPVVQQGFGHITPDPEATRDSIPDPKVNNNFAADLGSVLGNVPNVGSTPALMVSNAASLRGYAQGLHSDAQLPNLHSLHDPVVQQGFDDITPDPEATWGLIPDPKVNNNYAADLGSSFGNVPNAGSTPALMVSTAASLRGYAQGLHSDAQLPNLHLLHHPVVQQGFGDITPDPEAMRDSIADPKVNNFSADLGSMFGNVPNVGSTPALMVSNAASLRGYAQRLHSDAQLRNLHSLHNPVVQQGFGDITSDPEAPGGLIPDPNVNNYAADLGSLFGNVPNAGWTPALMVPFDACTDSFNVIRALYD